MIILYIHAYIKMKFNDRDSDIDMKYMMRQSNARCQERRGKSERVYIKIFFVFFIYTRREFKRKIRCVSVKNII